MAENESITNRGSAGPGDCARRWAGCAGPIPVIVDRNLAQPGPNHRGTSRTDLGLAHLPRKARGY
jgi:hypothetical protein